jgi:hypothetical protein
MAASKEEGLRKKTVSKEDHKLKKRVLNSAQSKAML